MSDLVKSPERLKQSIIDDAMKGKLTNQLTSDGNSKQQVKNIFKAKIQLAKKYKVRNYNKHFNLINNNDIPYKLPHNWVWVTLNDVCELLNGRAYKRQEMLSDNSLTPILRVGNLYTDKKWYYSDLQLAKKYYAYNNDLLYSWSASFGPKIWKGPKVIFHYHIWKILMPKEYFDENYMYYVLDDITKFAKSESHGTSMKHITKTKMNNIPIPIPPLSEQHRIVQRLNEILPKVDDLNKDVVKLDLIRTKFPHRLKQSLLLEAMKGHLTQQLPSDGTADDLLQKIQQKKQQLIQAGKIRKHKKLPPISKDEIPFEIPKNWKWVRLGNISKVLMGQSPKKGTVSKGIADRTHYEFHQGKACFGHIYLKKSCKITTSNSKIVKPGTILMSVRAPVGSINRTNRLIAIGRGLCGINPICLNTKYIYLYLDSQKYALQSKSTGTTFKAINKTNIKNFICPVPPLAEQHRIVSIIQKCFSLL